MQIGKNFVTLAPNQGTTAAGEGPAPRKPHEESGSTIRHIGTMLRNQVVDPLFPKCPIRNVVARIGGRWTLLVLLTLQDKGEPMRFRDLAKAIPDVSTKMLSSTLRDLEADDLVARKVYPEVPPRVEYRLTARGESLMPLLNQLVDWSLNNMSDILNSRKNFLART